MDLRALLTWTFWKEHTDTHVRKFDELRELIGPIKLTPRAVKY